MKETELRIQKYKAMLPRARERVIAALMIFVFSIAMLTVSTFSWITLSVAPEVSGATTTIAANGNLEIALAKNILLDDKGEPVRDEDGNVIAIPPSASAIGDSLLSITQKNLTWGNIVNLSDASYGLENITLRPATLNTSSLLSQPLYSATYGVDGRIKTLISNFEYTKWDNDKKQFMSSNTKGVKAISSVEYEEFDFPDPNAKKYYSMLYGGSETDENGNIIYDYSSNNVETLFRMANQNYSELTGEIGKVSGLVSTYLNGLLKGTDEVCNDADVLAFYNLMIRLDNEVVSYAGEAFMRVFELYQIQTAASNTDYNPVQFKTLDEFCAGVEKELENMNKARNEANQISFTTFTVSTTKTNTTLSQYINDRALLAKNIETIRPYAEKIESGVAANVKWSSIESTVNSLVNISTATLKDKTLQQWFSSLKQNLSGIYGILTGSYSANTVIIHDGLIERLDKLLHTGSGIYVEKIVINADGDALNVRTDGLIKSDQQVKASIRTDALTDLEMTNTGDYAGKSISTSQQDIDFAALLISAPATQRGFVAKDTYGLSIDFWVRTNGSASYLVLEGDVITKDEPILQTIVYPVTNGENQTSNFTQENTPIYLVDIITKTTSVDSSTNETVTNQYTENGVEVYQRDGDTTNWYYVRNHEMVNIGTSTDEIEGTTITITNPVEKTKEVVVGYSGVNRIWPNDTNLDEYSTSQGSGSCYTFYADTPEDMSQSLEIISALKVAFVDSEGHLMAMANFDTELYYAEYGRVIVPLKLDVANSIDTGSIDDEGDSIYAIKELEKNKATLITAIVYLDGKQVSNDKVLASSDIQGKLNIQFGAYKSPEALEDEKLLTETREITASVDKNSFASDEDWTVNVKLNVTGTEPSKITANFIRAINSTQGSRQNEFSFTKTDDSWVSEYKFDTPGTYVLRNVTVDGVEYYLKQPVTVTIPGFSFTVQGEYGQNHTYMTADSFKTERFTISVNALAGNYPGSVKGVFTNENNISITSNYTSSDGGKTWLSDVTFTSSGSYTMQYIIIDGQYYDISATITRKVYTSLSTKIYISVADTYEVKEELSYPLGGIQYKNFGLFHDFAVSAVILDDAGNEIQALTGVNLDYGGVDAGLRWNFSSGRYEGHFTISTPKTYRFNGLSVNVGVGNETINVATQAPVIYSLATEPVKYIGLESAVEDSVIAINEGDDTETITLMFEHAESAGVIYGKFSKTVEGITTFYIVEGSNTNTTPNYYTFTLPRVDGYWKLEAVKMQNVYDGKIFYTADSEKEYQAIVASDVEYTEDAISDAFDNAGYDTDGNNYYYEVVMTDAQKAELTETKVIAKIHTTYSGEYSDLFEGKAFMVPYTGAIPSLSVTFTDFEGEVITGISNVKLDFIYTAQDGGYTSDYLANENVGFVINFTSSDNKNFTSGSRDLLYAGTYTVKFSYIYNGHTEEPVMPDGWHSSVKVKSVAPSVKITGISPTGSNPAKITYTTKSSLFGTSPTFTATGNQNSSYTLYSATVYAVATADNDSQKHGGFTQPKLTITVDGVDGNSTVSFILPAGDANAITFSRTGNGAITKTLGSVSQIKSWDEKLFGIGYTHTLSAYYGHGNNAVIDKMTIVRNGVTYTVTLDNPITINNPSSVNQS